MALKRTTRKLIRTRSATRTSAADAEGRLLRVERAAADAGALMPAPRMTAAERQRRRTRWGRHVLLLAPLLAEALDAETALLSPLGRGEDLRGRAERVRRLSALREVFADLAQRAGDLLLVEKSELHDDCQLVLGELRSAIGSRLVAPEVAARLAAAATPALQLVSKRQAAITTKRRARSRRRAGARGATAPPVPAAPETIEEVDAQVDRGPPALPGPGPRPAVGTG